VAETKLVKLANSRLPEALALARLPEAVAATLADAPDVPAAIDRLEGQGKLLDAARLLAHALPPREAVWWACQCARHVPVPELTDADRACLEAAETWVRQPKDAPRRAAMAQAEKAAFATAEAWAAVGAFWSGGSMAPEGQPIVPPAANLCGTAISGSVALASVRGRPERADARLARFLAAGRDIAAGGTGRLPAEEG
jgi:hypothetical protein